MPERNYNFDVYQITAQTKEVETDFSTVLDMAIKSFPPFALYSGSVVMLEKKSKNGIYSMMLAHNQMNDLPHVMNNVTGVSRELGLDKKEGLAHRTCFVYDSKLKMLLVESIKNGVTLNYFVNLIQRAVPDLDIQTSFVLNPDIIDSLRKMTIIKKFEFKIAKIANGNIFDSDDASLKDYIKSVKDTGLDKLTVNLQAGLSRADSLNRKKIMGIIKTLRKFFGTKEVQRVEITGKESEEQLIQPPLDLLSGKLRFQIKLEVKRYYSDVDIMSKCALVVEKLEEKRKALKVVYSQDGNQN